MKIARLWPLTFVPVLAFPISNPDLFWHLSAARRIRELGALPAADWLSSTRAGAPWVDFEWLPQLIFDILYRHGGFVSLWLLKAALIGASALIVVRTIELYTNDAAAKAGAASLWAAASLTRSDIRPELFSLLGFGAVFYTLERRRLGLKIPGPAWCAALFCVWANLHPGWVYGLILVGLYAAAELAGRRARPWAYPAAALLGCALQPYPIANAEIVLRHWRELDAIAAHIAEWTGPRLDDPWQWPFWIVLFAGFGALLLATRRGRTPPLGPLAAFLLFGFSASRHLRTTAYSVACAVPLTLLFLRDAKAVLSRALLAAVWVLFTAYSIFCARLYGFGRVVFNDHFVPVAAADYLAAHADELPRDLYNPWHWGGYLGWRLHPRFLVFQDGRYLFHDLLQETADALASPRDWAAFLRAHRIDLALLENKPLIYEGKPYWESFMPARDWALVHRDPRALVFVRRKASRAAGA